MNPDLILIAAALFTWGIGEGMFTCFQSIYLQRLGANPILIGSILGASGLVMTLAHIPAGHLSDKLGRKPVIFAAWIIGLVATALMALSDSLPLFITALLLYSVTAFVVSPLNSYFTAARGTWSVKNALSLSMASFTLGASAGASIGGWTGDRYGLKTVYIAASLIFAVSTIIMCMVKSQPRDHHDPLSPPGALWKNPAYLLFMGLVFLVMFALFLPQPLTPNFLQNERGLSLSAIGFLGSLSMLSISFMGMLFGALFSTRAGFITGQILSMVFALIIWKGSGMPLYALAYILLGGARATRPLAAAHVRGLAHKSQMGLAFGINEAINGMALMLAPVIAGVLYERAPTLVYPVSIAVLCFAILMTVILLPRKERIKATTEEHGGIRGKIKVK